MVIKEALHFLIAKTLYRFPTFSYYVDKFGSIPLIYQTSMFEHGLRQCQIFELINFGIFGNLHPFTTPLRPSLLQIHGNLILTIILVLCLWIVNNFIIVALINLNDLFILKSSGLRLIIQHFCWHVSQIVYDAVKFWLLLLLVGICDVWVVILLNPYLCLIYFFLCLSTYDSLRLIRRSQHVRNRGVLYVIGDDGWSQVRIENFELFQIVCQLFLLHLL